eukprot:366441-Chlamydomonas_euryale.AAC.28
MPLRSVMRSRRLRCPLAHRIESAPGSGLHLSPTGVEFDDRLLRLGNRLSVRTAVGMTFPRSLPIDWENDDIGFKASSNSRHSWMRGSDRLARAGNARMDSEVHACMEERGRQAGRPCMCHICNG